MASLPFQLQSASARSQLAGTEEKNDRDTTAMTTQPSDTQPEPQRPVTDPAVEPATADKALPDETSQTSSRPWAWIAIAVVAVLIAAGIALDGNVDYHPGIDSAYAPQPVADGTYDAGSWGPASPLASPQDLPAIARRNPTDALAIGAADAPVTIVEFSDFECPYCAEFATTVEPELLSNYVATGKVRLEWNDFPVNGEHAIAAAKAGRAAAAQGKFQEFKRALYSASNPSSGHPNNTIDDFVVFAEQAGVPDIDKFRADATGTTYDETIQQATDYATQLGIRGTPTLAMDGKPLPGGITYPQLAELIDQQLAAIESGQVTPTKPGTTDGRDYPTVFLERATN